MELEGIEIICIYVLYCSSVIGYMFYQITPTQRKYCNSSAVKYNYMNGNVDYSGEDSKQRCKVL